MNPAPLFRRAGLFWLALGLGLSWLAALALCRAEAWGAAWQSLSRAGTECLAFGWASLAGAERGLAIACPQPWGPWRRRAFLAAWLLWNLGLLLQLAGGRAEFLFLGSAALLFLGAWTARRAAPELSAAEAWALAAFAALPLLLLARALPASPFGLGAAVAAGWAEGAFFGLWLVPLALAVVYDGWPAAPVPCRGPAALALAAWLLGAGALGGGRFVGGPVPLWIGTVGAAASLFLLIPALALGLSLAEAAPRAGRRALGWALAAGALWVLGGVFLSLRAGAALFQFTFCETAWADLGLLGFVGVALASGLSLPPAAGWTAGAGLFLLLGAEACGGLLQAFGQRDPHVPWRALGSLLSPFLAARAGGWLLLLLALFQLAARRVKR